MPTKDTLLQKVIPEANIAKYLDGRFDPEIGGYIARADDISHARKMEDVIETAHKKTISSGRSYEP